MNTSSRRLCELQIGLHRCALFVLSLVRAGTFNPDNGEGGFSMKLTRRNFIQASVGSGGLLMLGMPVAAQPVTNAMALRKAKPAAAAKGEWGSTACQGGP